MARVLADKAPDLVQFSYPYAIMDFARQGKVIDVSQVIDLDTLRSNFDQQWLDWATVTGPDGPIMGGVWYVYNVDSIVWGIPRQPSLQQGTRRPRPGRR